MFLFLFIFILLFLFFYFDFVALLAHCSFIRDYYLSTVLRLARLIFIARHILPDSSPNYYFPPAAWEIVCENCSSTFPTLLILLLSVHTGGSASPPCCHGLAYYSQVLWIPRAYAYAQCSPTYLLQHALDEQE